MRSLALVALLLGGCTFVLDFDGDLFDAGPDARPLPDARPPRVDATVDTYEPNNTLGTARSISPGTYQLSVSPLADRDFLGFNLTTGSVTVDCLFTVRDGDLDLRLYDNTGAVVAAAADWVDDEHLARTGLAPGMYYLEVYAFDDRFENSYTLVLDAD